MNVKTFLAMLLRDAQVARRNFVTLVPGPTPADDVRLRVRPRDDDERMMSPEYRTLLLPGIMALSMVMTGTWAVAMPLVSEFQFTKEIEDRLLAPMEIEWLAVEKIVAGMIQALVMLCDEKHKRTLGVSI